MTATVPSLETSFRYIHPIDGNHSPEAEST